MAVSSEIPGGMVGSAILGQHKAPAARSTLNTGGDNYEYWPIYTGISIAVCLPAALRSSSVYQYRVCQLPCALPGCSVLGLLHVVAQLSEHRIPA